MLELPSFKHPHALLLIVVAIVAVWWSLRPQMMPAAIFSSLSDLRQIPPTLAQRIRNFMPFVRALGFCLLIVALARPQKGIVETRISSEGIAIQATLDLSGSMLAMDFTIDNRQVTRLEAVKHIFKQFVTGGPGLPGRPNDLIGIVSFGGYAHSRCPLTLDHGAVVAVIDSLEIPKIQRDRRGNIINRKYIMEEWQTAIGDALITSIDRLQGVEAKSKIVILLSDGDSNAGVADPLEAAEAAKALGIKVYTIGIGHNGMAYFEEEDMFGNKRMRPQRVEFSGETLTTIAEITGGKYFHAQDSDTLKKVYEQIDRLERTKTQQLSYTEYKELFFYPMLLGLILILIDGLLFATRFRALP